MDRIASNGVARPLLHLNAWSIVSNLVALARRRTADARRVPIDDNALRSVRQNSASQPHANAIAEDQVPNRAETNSHSKALVARNQIRLTRRAAANTVRRAAIKVH